jgi:hypothetical protein
MIYCFDIDETICNSPGLDYSQATPILQRIQKINQLYAQGHTIKLYTARGSMTGIDWSEITRAQLVNWGLSFHELNFGKPFADFYVDDKAINESDFDWSSN